MKRRGSAQAIMLGLIVLIIFSLGFLVYYIARRPPRWVERIPSETKQARVCTNKRCTMYMKPFYWTEEEEQAVSRTPVGSVLMWRCPYCNRFSVTNWRKCPECGREYADLGKGCPYCTKKSEARGGGK